MYTWPKDSPGRRSTHAPNTEPAAIEMYLSHGSAWMPRVTPFFALKLMLFCTGPKSGRPRLVCFARCQFSLNQPRLSPCTGRSNTSSPGMFVSSTLRSFSKSIKSIFPVCSHPMKRPPHDAPGRRKLDTRLARDAPSGHWPCCLYLASVAALAGSHHWRLLVYQSMVAFRPDSKLVCVGFQPNSVRSLVESIA